MYTSWAFAALESDAIVGTIVDLPCEERQKVTLA